jgi:hypothetical protein
MLDVADLGEKFHILFIAQTGMRVSAAVALRIGDVQRELDLGNVPLAIRLLPKKDRELIGERIAFIGSDGVLENIEYEPEQFPGMVYRIREPKVVMLLFSTGKIVCTGAKSVEDVSKTAEKLSKELDSLGLLH